MTTTIELYRDIPFNADIAWYWVGDRFGDIAQWSSALSASCMLESKAPREGAARTCQSPASWPFPGGTVTEVLLAFDPVAMSLTYRAIEGLPWFIRDATNRWSVSANGPNGCRIAMTASLQMGLWGTMLGPAMLPMMKKMGRRVLEELEELLAAESTRTV